MSSSSHTVELRHHLPPEALDNLATYTSWDPSSFRDRIRALPNQCRKVARVLEPLSLPAEFHSIDQVILAGMGASAIAGDLLSDLASLEHGPLITVWRNYDLPHFTNERTLVMACSYSGETEETLSSFRRAIAIGARTVVVTGGGTLLQEAQQARVPVIPIDYQGEPRTAIGYSLLAPFHVLTNLGALPGQKGRFECAVEELEKLLLVTAEEVPLPQNPAKQLARDLLGKLAVVYGGGIFAGVARRWKSQLNENAKVWAFAEVLPDANHSSVVGYRLPEEVRDRAFVLMLLPGHLHPRTMARYQLTQGLLHDAGIPTRLIEGKGDDPLSQILTAVLLGDYTSYYLAMLQRIDPSPIRAIDHIRSRMARDER